MNRVLSVFVGVLVAALLPPCHVAAQNMVIEESATVVNCDSRTHSQQHFREVRTILNEQGAKHASFVCSCSRNDKLTHFKGTVTDGAGRVLRKLKESDLQRTEYSQYLAIDAFMMYLEYTPPTYPVTIAYEWTMDSRDNVIEFPRFCPQADYDVSVKKATYQLTAPKEMQIRYNLQYIGNEVKITDADKDLQSFSLEISDLKPMCKEPYGRLLTERMPVAYFAPTEFTYYGTEGSLNSWNDYGKWEYSLIDGRDELPESVKQELHRLTDGLTTDREKVEALYKRLAATTRYVAVLLGIGGQQPALASSVAKSGFGDCKGLSNYMRAMLKEVGIPSNYTAISTTNKRLISSFPSVGQMNHVILQVPLQGDTLWLECTNPQLPLGYVHENIAGHDAIEISERGGRLVRLPAYPDSTNLMHNKISITLDENGIAEMVMSQLVRNHQYEHYSALSHMGQKERKDVMGRIVSIPEVTFSDINVSEKGASVQVDYKAEMPQYVTATGQYLFVPVCPVHQGYSAPRLAANRQEDVCLETGYLDVDDITITIPEAYAVEAIPQNVQLDEPFGTFSFHLQKNGSQIHIQNRLLFKSGQYPQSSYPRLVDFIKSVGSAYKQKIVLKRMAS